MTHDALYSSYTPLNFPVYVTARCAGSACNLQCKFSKYDQEATDTCDEPMSSETMQLFIKQYADAQIHASVNFMWAGGEPMLCGLDYFKEIVAMQRRIAPNRTITNTIRTNATLVDEAWCEFLKANGFRVEVLLDGPDYCHNHFRSMPDGGNPFELTMRGVRLLAKHEVPMLVLAAVNSYNVRFPLETYRFFKENRLRHVRFYPITGTKHSPVAECIVPSAAYGSFLCTIFDDWARNDVGRMHIEIFDNTFRVFCRQEGHLCFYAPTCGHYAMLDKNGDIYSCRHFFRPENRIGNIHESTLTGLMYGRKQLRFGQQKRAGLTLQCKRCPYLRYCNGGCLKERIATSMTGEKHHNVLCEGYRKFFEHVTPLMTFMAEEAFTHGDSARVMSFFESSPH